MLLELHDISLTINGYVAACHCRCSHCLLCSGDGILPRIDFHRLNELTLRFTNVSSIYGFTPSLCVYNCAEHPYLKDEIETNRYLSNPHAGYMNLNGTRIREGIELREWVSYLKGCGVIHANLSWFGNCEFHDAFCHAEGYHDYLINLAHELKAAGIKWNNTIFILKSNIGQLSDLVDKLSSFEENLHFSLLDYRGNGKNMLHEFLSQHDKAALPDFLHNTNLFTRNRPESEWIDLIKRDQHPKLSKRMLFLVATNDNVDTYLNMSLGDIFKMFNDIDSRLQKLIPSIEFLCDNYGDGESQIMMDYRSILWKWLDSYFVEESFDKSLLFSDLHTSVMWR